MLPAPGQQHAMPESGIKLLWQLVFSALIELQVCRPNGTLYSVFLN